MPELPEVETIRKQLDKVLSGKVVEKVEVLREKSFSGDKDVLLGKRVESVGRKSKVIEFLFEESDLMVICHLKMTGQLIYTDGDNRIVGGHPTADWIKDLPSKHTRIVWSFTDGTKLYFNDMRVFGWMRVVDRKKFYEEDRKRVPDVTEKEFNFDYLKKVLSRSKKPVKLVILDQDKLGGVGNIYANDALFLAKIMPTKSANTLDDKEIKRLVEAIKEVINRGIKYGGASAADDKYVNALGLGGKYQNYFLVYQKGGQKCPVCGEEIKKTRIGGRGTFYCEFCQN